MTIVTMVFATKLASDMLNSTPYIYASESTCTWALFVHALHRCFATAASLPIASFCDKTYSLYLILNGISQNAAHDAGRVQQSRALPKGSGAGTRA